MRFRPRCPTAQTCMAMRAGRPSGAGRAAVLEPTAWGSRARCRAWRRARQRWPRASRRCAALRCTHACMHTCASMMQDHARRVSAAHLPAYACMRVCRAWFSLVWMCLDASGRCAWRAPHTHPGPCKAPCLPACPPADPHLPACLVVHTDGAPPEEGAHWELSAGPRQQRSVQLCVRHAQRDAPRERGRCRRYHHRCCLIAANGGGWGQPAGGHGGGRYERGCCHQKWPGGAAWTGPCQGGLSMGGAARSGAIPGVEIIFHITLAHLVH